MDSSGNLVLYENDTLIDFESSVFYKCKDDHYFDEDHEKDNFSIECHSDGTFDPIHSWTFCEREQGNNKAPKKLQPLSRSLDRSNLY